MHTYCFSCKNTLIIFAQKLITKNKVTTEASRCANFMSDKSRFLKQKPNKKTNCNNILKLFI